MRRMKYVDVHGKIETFNSIEIQLAISVRLACNAHADNYTHQHIYHLTPIIII